MYRRTQELPNAKQTNSTLGTLHVSQSGTLPPTNCLTSPPMKLHNTLQTHITTTFGHCILFKICCISSTVKMVACSMLVGTLTQNRMVHIEWYY